MKNKISPMMHQYLLTKEKYKDSILFYRLGDFYEMFYEDAVEISKVLDLTLTHKSCGLEEPAPMCGVPYHAADGYIAKLINLGYKVAICEQLTPAGTTKLVERDVIKVITPGTVTDDAMLEEKKNNYIMCLFYNLKTLSICYCDITTGEFNLLEFEKNINQEFIDLLNRIMPSEIIGNVYAKDFYIDLDIQKLGVYPKFQDYFDYAFGYERADQNMTKQFGENYINVFELVKCKNQICCAGALIEYLNETQKRSLININKIQKSRNKNFMVIDINTRRNLELVETIRDKKKYASLLWLLDNTKTSMGARRFRTMFDQPLCDDKEINKRLDGVEELVKRIILRDNLGEALSHINDIERLSGKIAYGNVMPNDLISLKNSLKQIPNLKELLSDIKSEKLISCRENLLDLSKVVDLLDKAINPEPPSLLKDGGYIAEGFNEELDEYRLAKRDGLKWIKELEEKEREATGIKNLKIGYNSVFGYYIEVNNSALGQVPLSYVRKQTISNNERFINEDLKVIENKILNATENSIKLEAKLYASLKEFLLGFVVHFQDVAKAIAEIDSLLSLAITAVKNNFVRPKINKNINHIKIIDGRHPIVEKFISDSSFIANDTYLDGTENKVMVITGPNMAGKSTYMRQVAVITFMAHIGSFVPAKEAEISLTDRIFTRVGASDDLAFGQSTFMVEMSEVANILANASDKSLVILDEIGRGTSTFDGLSIAWAVVEYVVNNKNCKTLFATHYHELSQLESIMNGVKNYKVSVKELNDSVVFLRKIERGQANKSFGIEVAKLAGVPKDVITRAKEISYNLEKVNKNLDLNIINDDDDKKQQEDKIKLGLQVLSELKDIDMNRLTPLTAFDMLLNFVNKSKGE